MKKFLIKFTLFTLIIAATAGPLFYWISRDFSDRFYYKFMRPSGSLVTGSSRALLGIDPDKLGNGSDDASEWLNFAFTQSTSPYGQVYYDAIMKKVKKRDHPGTFILEVGPLSVSMRGDSTPESRLILGRLSVFNMEPNIDYILKNNQQPLYFFFFHENKKSPTFIPHRNGWNQNLKQPDSISLANGIKTGVEAHTKVFSESAISPERLKWLEKTLTSLSGYGKVVLLRMPVGPEMKEMEDRYAPDFNAIMSALAKKNKATYLDLRDTGKWDFYDVHHMTSGSAKRFSTLLGDTLHKIGVN